MKEPAKRISISFLSWVKLALVVALVYAGVKLSGIFMVLLIAIFISAAIEPGLSWAKNRGVPRIVMTILVYALTAGLLSYFFYFLLLPLIDQFSSFVKTLTIYTNSVSTDSVLSKLFVSQHVFGGIQSPVLMSELGTYLNSFSQLLSQGIFSTAALFFGGVLNLILIVVLSFYLSVQDDGVGKFLKVVVPVQYERYIVGLWHRSRTKIGYWMQGQLILGLTVAVMVFFSLTFVGVPNALLFAVLSGLFELIPIFGPIISALPAIFSAYGTLGGTEAVVVAAIFLVIQQLENHVFYPMVVKKVVGVPPIVSILALIIGGELGGFLGIIVSVPVAVVLIEILDDMEKEKLAVTQNN